ncbi:MAG: hypothetical protein E6J90_27760 [Deltaproteobacteria bacterium]|nr:MAG: hypothetical protein E6J91_34595 [Deltaproteobacteria bacterium]TMQ13845.1 MAG: hypothetical protein E6J90_27760 [Deltaproteobacteria bacterium]
MRGARPRGDGARRADRRRRDAARRRRLPRRGGAEHAAALSLRVRDRAAGPRRRRWDPDHDPLRQPGLAGRRPHAADAAHPDPQRPGRDQRRHRRWAAVAGGRAAPGLTLRWLDAWYLRAPRPSPDELARAYHIRAPPDHVVIGDTK